MYVLITVALAGLTLIGVGLAAGGNYVGRPSRLPPPSGPPPGRPRPPRHAPPSGSKRDQLAADLLEQERDKAVSGMLMALVLMDEVTAALGQQQYGLACRHLRCGPEVYRSLPLSSIGPARTAIWKGVEVVEVEGMTGWSLCDGGCRAVEARTVTSWVTGRPTTHEFYL